jgi:predicted transglutaminase-like cysteine proteinase
MAKQYCFFLCAFVALTFFFLPAGFTQSLINDKQIDEIKKKHGENAKRRLIAWRKILVSNIAKSDREKLIIVNNFFNQLEYKSDISYTGQPDYWMTPIEFLVAAGGDCEDFSIAKYFTLVALGVPEEKLRITYVKALELNQAHMVLAYYTRPDAEPYILDNLSSKVLPASKRPDLAPVYSFNAEGLWLSKQRGQTKRVGKSKSLSKWRGVLQRMKQEGDRQ